MSGSGRFGDPSQDPPGTCRWRNPRDSGPWIKVADNRWVHVGGGGGQEDEVVAEWPIGTLRAPGPIDWPARLRASAEAIDTPTTALIHRRGLAAQLRSVAGQLDISCSDLTDAFGRALLGEAP